MRFAAALTVQVQPELGFILRGEARVLLAASLLVEAKAYCGIFHAGREWDA